MGIYNILFMVKKGLIPKEMTNKVITFICRNWEKAKHIEKNCEMQTFSGAFHLHCWTFPDSQVL